MKIFITGASGYVGSVVAEKAVQAGHQVVGLVRSETSAAKVTKLGAQPLLATLNDTEELAKAAKESDAVLHLGFVHDFSRPYNELLNIDIAAIQAMGKALAGTNKPLVTTSGTGVVKSNNGQETDEESEIADGLLGSRTKAEKATTDFAKDGVRAICIRLAPYVYGRGGSYFVPITIQAAAKNGYAPYVDDGATLSTAADVDAAADLYLLAMEKGKAGSIYICSTETDLQIKKLAEAVGIALGVPAQSVSMEKARELAGTFTAQFYKLENRASSAKARTELGWNPTPKFSVCDDIVKGSYKTLIDELQASAKVHSL